MPAARKSGRKAAKVLAYVYEPGGANVLAPLLRSLRSDFGLYVVCAASSYACSRMEGAADSLLTAEDFFRQEPDLSGFGLLVTGCSAPTRGETGLWQRAAGIGLPTAAVLDQWMNYRERFSDPGDGRIVLPDLIAVPDLFAVTEMTALGFSEERLFIAGHPYLASIGKTAGVRPAALAKGREVRVLFVAEPIELAAVKPGYTEFSILKALVDALNDAGGGRRFALTCKLHPRHRSDAFAGICVDGERVKCRMVQDCDARSLVGESDLVAGMSSMLLMESVLMGKPTLSIQIGLCRPDPFVLSRMGVMRSALDEAALREQLRLALEGQVARWSIEPSNTRELARKLSGMLRTVGGPRVS